MISPDCPRTAGELARLIGAEVVGDGDRAVAGMAEFEVAGPEHVTTIWNPKLLKRLDTTQAGTVILAEAPQGDESRTWLVHAQPRLAYTRAIDLFYSKRSFVQPGVHASAVVDPSASLGKNVTIGPQCVIEPNVTIGDNTVLRAQCFVGEGTTIGNDCLFHSRVSVREDSIIGDRVIVQDGAVIGSDGFGFEPDETGFHKIQHVGRVILEDDVEIGACTTIDRGTLTATIIRRGAKLDNLIQIGHNVEVGANTVFAAQVGIAGSTKIGARSMFGGQVGVAGHISLSDGVQVAAQSGIAKDPGEGKTIGGTPAVDIREWQRAHFALGKLPKLIKVVRKLENGGK